MCENREARRSPVGVDDAPPDLGRGVAGRRRVGREGKAMSRKPEMNDCRESDSCVVPAKLANKAGRSAAEPVEGRRLDEGNMGQQNALRTQGRKGARRVRWSVCAESQGRTGMRGSRRFCTTSASIACVRPIAR